MVSYATLVLAVLAGYVVTVTLALAGTIGIVSASPRFAIRHHRVRAPYKLVHETMWTVCVVAGAYAGMSVGWDVVPWRMELLLIVVLLAVLWRNAWEARQRGTAHQILISLLTIVGSVIGTTLQQRFPL